MDMATSATSEAMRRAGSAPSSSSSSPSDSGTDFVSESELLPLLLDAAGVDAADDEPVAFARLPLLREGSWASSSSAANAWCGARRRPPLKNSPPCFGTAPGFPGGSSRCTMRPSMTPRSRRRAAARGRASKRAPPTRRRRRSRPSYRPASRPKLDRASMKVALKVGSCRGQVGRET